MRNPPVVEMLRSWPRGISSGIPPTRRQIFCVCNFCSYCASKCFLTISEDETCKHFLKFKRTFAIEGRINHDKHFLGGRSLLRSAQLLPSPSPVTLPLPLSLTLILPISRVRSTSISLSSSANGCRYLFLRTEMYRVENTFLLFFLPNRTI